MNHRSKLILLGILALSLIATFLLINLGSNWSYLLSRRGMKIFAILLTGSAIALSTIIFQTITHNRILTPSILGLDSLYLLIQTIVIYFFGATTLTMMNNHVHFLLSVGLMVLFANFLYKVFFGQEDQSIYFLLLIGMIFGILFNSLSSFMQVLIDPNEFQILQDRMFASFNNIHTERALLSSILLLISFLYFLRFYKYLDVLSLGKDQAVNLGVNYEYVVKRLLIIVSILISIATALVGPITFLGLLVVNVTYEVFWTYQHRYLIPGSIVISLIALIGGQLIVERIFTFETTLSVIINFVGGIYFIYLLLKERHA